MMYISDEIEGEYITHWVEGDLHEYVELRLYNEYRFILDREEAYALFTFLKEKFEF